MKKIAEWLRAQKGLVFALALVAFLGVGATMAWFTDTEAAVNTLTVGNGDITVDEKIVGLEKRNIGIKNEGSVPVYVRMRVDVPEGITYIASDSDAPQEVTFTFIPKEPTGWTHGDDGYWYYDESVEPDKEFITLFNSIKLSSKIPESQMELIKDMLDITVYGECVQSEGLPEDIKTAQEAFAYIAELKK